ncbi:MAG: hypothetical protein OXH36_02765 [Bdellovibrionales bacterium]|nr:hypothetical protein [Bdellovibrionales bacterium]
MKQVFTFICLVFFISGCSRIGFYSNQDSKGLVIDHKLDGPLECDNNKVNCMTKGEEGNPFLRARYEGSPGHLVEYFEISGREEMEFVIVVDASQSMDDNLKKVGENLQPVLSHIHDKKWRMVFMTADHGDHTENTSEIWEDYHGDKARFGKFMRLEKNGRILDQLILTEATPEYDQIFKDTLTRRSQNECDLPPGCHGPHEQPLRSLKAAFSRYETDPSHKSFFQADADTIVLIMTDEDERRQDPQNATTAEEVIQVFKEVFKGKRKRLFAFSLSIQDEECYEEERRGIFSKKTAAYGHIIGRLAELTGRPEQNVSLCSKDYGAALARISQITRSLIESDLVLQKLFLLPETVEVSLDPIQEQVSWKLFGRKIRLSDPVQPGTKVKVSYQYER